ncbi:hypothetical protein NEPAR06_1418 [Nematocida parisii]|uniref:Uncharacterized protein n=1 Tax=Nematocida parisii (strain ERTm3) TaxID=935791 RepID=I3EKB8_NEMP3|nr:uncharacterized protein NEPG_00800 [Nematocida parisii ERTm1]EIJ89665.1 hypothetical protein NEQG_00435 [Nematocida parisii ERTm3]KAI5143367.1 hypothetical protein NEPAR07_0587 [Nematocida parisii]EIJ94133.1 hypothetical protein NEPG_00800 [Nematocida parisii ERTm1]KAI5154952.1 hypothetical protein NEPAR06_1418 [Nematocida parisii]KAI5156291.1 hypothetical protein NEPAR05_0452 [Nematocida parisii]|eukprot:XP_013058629.1 hypothetical protein NEPG_00800 [Nematocida parisii ERTm1]
MSIIEKMRLNRLKFYISENILPRDKKDIVHICLSKIDAIKAFLRENSYVLFVSILIVIINILILVIVQQRGQILHKAEKVDAECMTDSIQTTGFGAVTNSVPTINEMPFQTKTGDISETRPKLARSASFNALPASDSEDGASSTRNLARRWGSDGNFGTFQQLPENDKNIFSAANGQKRTIGTQVEEKDLLTDLNASACTDSSKKSQNKLTGQFKKFGKSVKTKALKIILKEPKNKK